MTQKPSDDEASFEGLISFDTVPPPMEAAGGASDVHNARTTVAELPDSFLDSLKVADAGAAHAHAPRPVAPAPELLAKSTVLVDFTGTPDDLESAFASALETLPPAPPPPAPLFQQPYPSPAAEFSPHAPAAPCAAPGLASATTDTARPPPPARAQTDLLQAVGWRGALVALAALLLGFGVALWLRAHLVHVPW